jgi:hypothetical protein
VRCKLGFLLSVAAACAILVLGKASIIEKQFPVGNKERPDVVAKLGDTDLAHGPVGYAPLNIEKVLTGHHVLVGQNWVISGVKSDCFNPRHRVRGQTNRIEFGATALDRSESRTSRIFWNSDLAKISIRWRLNIPSDIFPVRSESGTSPDISIGQYEMNRAPAFHESAAWEAFETDCIKVYPRPVGLDQVPVIRFVGLKLGEPQDHSDARINKSGYLPGDNYDDRSS